MVQQPGPLISSDKLTISVIATKHSKTDTSSEINVKKLAVVRFQFRVIKEQGRYNHRIACSFSHRKYSSMLKDEIKISLTCKEQNYSEEWMTTENWSAWNEIGNQDKKEMESNYPDVYLHTFEFAVNAIEVASNLFAKLYDDKDFTDFQLSSSEGSVSVHKACLASHSDMFKIKLANEWKDSAECRIEQDGVTMETLQHLKDYLYLGSLQDCYLRQLLLIAKHYKMKNLQAECVFSLARKVTSADLFDLLEFARENEIRELTLALIELTPKEVVESVSQSINH